MLTKCMIAVFLLMCNPLYASLGEVVDANAVYSASPAPTIQSRRAQVQNYTVREAAYSGTGVIREYISLQGKIFAVSWKGPLMPDLNQLLGHYFQPYIAGLESSTKKQSRSMVNVQTPELVVHSRGRLRAFSGVAYLPQFLPVGVTAGDLQ